MMTPKPSPPPLPAERIVAAEDRVTAWLDANADEFSQAAMFRQLSLRGWTHERAHSVVQRVWNHMGKR